VDEKQSSAAEREIDELSVLDVAVALAKRKKLVLGLPLTAGILALVIALLIPKTYTATARLLPPQQKESAASAMLGALAGVAVGGTGTVGQVLGLRNPNDLYVGILRGHTIADRLISRFDLMHLYDRTTIVKTRKALEDVTTISAGKDGLIAIEVEDENPKRAADMANGYVEELDRLMQGLAVTEASQRRLFFEKQLATVQDQLATGEIELRRAIDSKGIVGLDAQTRSVVFTAEQLRAQIAVKEIQLDAMRSFATPRNPEALRLRQEIASMRSELEKLEGGRNEDGVASLGGLENLRKLRELKFLEFTVELLTKQYEAARIDEAKDAISIQLVDRATPPDYKSKPKVALVVVLTVLGVGLVSVMVALFGEYLEKIGADPRTAEQLARLKQLLSWRA
jgi:tyrosine-protein kinase Etk/Wzc